MMKKLVVVGSGKNKGDATLFLKSICFQNNDILKCNTRKGLPCGSVGFVKRLGKNVGRDLSFKGVGRPKKG